MVSITIDGSSVSVKEGASILAAAKQAGIDIPTLCFMKELNDIGSCRMCLVQVEGQDELVVSCNTPVREGMVIHTSTPQVVTARRANLELLLSAHRSECTSCVRIDTCALRALAADFAVSEGEPNSVLTKEAWSEGFPLQRDASKCIKCMRCVAFCEKVQHCAVWDHTGSGSHMKITVKDGEAIEDSGCTLCGQCVTHCPTGALTARRDIDTVMDALLDPDTVTVVQVAPAVRAAWGEGVGLTHEEATPGRMASALRALGFDYVFDTDFTADLTIMEEGSEFIEFLKSDKPRPMYTSCCPGWVRFAKLHYPEVVPQLSSAKSPHQMLGALVKNTMKDKAGDKRLFCVSVMPCVAKKYECDVPELATDGGRDVDAVLTVREFDTMLRMFKVDCASLEETSFDDPLGASTGASTIFGRTGGVMEAALRTAVTLLTGKTASLDTCDCTEATPEKPWMSKELDVLGTTVRIAVASGLGNTAKLLDAIDSNEVAFDFVEIMACPGGCVGGGGQPIHFDRELAKERAQVLDTLDATDELRMSHDNPQIKQLYADWIGEPLSHTAHAWLHTNQTKWQI